MLICPVMPAQFHRFWSLELCRFLLLSAFLECLSSHDDSAGNYKHQLKTRPRSRSNWSQAKTTLNFVPESPPIASKFSTPTCSFHGVCISVRIVKPACWNGHLKLPTKGHVSVVLDLQCCEVHRSCDEVVTFYWTWVWETSLSAEIHHCRSSKVCRIPVLAINNSFRSPRSLTVLLYQNNISHVGSITVTGQGQHPKYDEPSLRGLVNSGKNALSKTLHSKKDNAVILGEESAPGDQSPSKLDGVNKFLHFLSESNPTKRDQGSNIVSEMPDDDFHFKNETTLAPTVDIATQFSSEKEAISQTVPVLSWFAWIRKAMRETFSLTDVKWNNDKMLDPDQFTYQNAIGDQGYLQTTLPPSETIKHRPLVTGQKKEQSKSARTAQLQYIKKQNVPFYSKVKVVFYSYITQLFTQFQNWQLDENHNYRKETEELTSKNGSNVSQAISEDLESMKNGESQFRLAINDWKVQNGIRQGHQIHGDPETTEKYDNNPQVRVKHNFKTTVVNDLKRQMATGKDEENDNSAVQVRFKRKAGISEADDIAALMQGEKPEDRDKISEMIASDFATRTDLSDPVVAPESAMAKALAAMGPALAQLVHSLKIEKAKEEDDEDDEFSADKHEQDNKSLQEAKLGKAIKRTEKQLAVAQSVREEKAAEHSALIGLGRTGQEFTKVVGSETDAEERVNNLKSSLRNLKMALRQAQKGVPAKGTKRKLHGLVTMEPMWGDWSAWSKCSAVCGDGGFSVRRRDCDTLPDISCEGVNFDMRPCNAGVKCKAQWQVWGNWGPCSVTCGSGLRARSRVCVSGTKEERCSGTSSRLEKCYQPKCEAVPRVEPPTESETQYVPGVPHAGPAAPGGEVPAHSGPGHFGTVISGPGVAGVAGAAGVAAGAAYTGDEPIFQAPEAPLAAHPKYGGKKSSPLHPYVWGAWGRWSSCSNKCGEGTRERKRLCVDNSQKTPVKVLSKHCGRGSRIQSRGCIGPCNKRVAPGAAAQAIGAGAAGAAGAAHGASFHDIHHDASVVEPGHPKGYPVIHTPNQGEAGEELPHKAEVVEKPGGKGPEIVAKHGEHEPEPERESQLSGETIMFIVILLLCLLLFIIAFCCWFISRSRESKRKEQIDAAQPFYKAEDNVCVGQGGGGGGGGGSGMIKRAYKWQPPDPGAEICKRSDPQAQSGHLRTSQEKSQFNGQPSSMNITSVGTQYPVFFKETTRDREGDNEMNYPYSREVDNEMNYPNGPGMQPLASGAAPSSESRGTMVDWATGDDEDPRRPSERLYTSDHGFRESQASEASAPGEAPKQSTSVESQSSGESKSKKNRRKRKKKKKHPGILDLTIQRSSQTTESTSLESGGTSSDPGVGSESASKQATGDEKKKKKRKRKKEKLVEGKKDEVADENTSENKMDDNFSSSKTKDFAYLATKIQLGENSTMRAKSEHLSVKSNNNSVSDAAREPSRMPKSNLIPEKGSVSAVKSPGAEVLASSEKDSLYLSGVQEECSTEKSRLYVQSETPARNLRGKEKDQSAGNSRVFRRVQSLDLDHAFVEEADPEKAKQSVSCQTSFCEDIGSELGSSEENVDVTEQKGEDLSDVRCLGHSGQSSMEDHSHSVQSFDDSNVEKVLIVHDMCKEDDKKHVGSGTQSEEFKYLKTRDKYRHLQTRGPGRGKASVHRSVSKRHRNSAVTSAEFIELRMKRVHHQSVAQSSSDSDVYAHDDETTSESSRIYFSKSKLEVISEGKDFTYKKKKRGNFRVDRTSSSETFPTGGHKDAGQKVFEEICGLDVKLISGHGDGEQKRRTSSQCRLSAVGDKSTSDERPHQRHRSQRTPHKAGAPRPHSGPASSSSWLSTLLSESDKKLNEIDQEINTVLREQCFLSLRSETPSPFPPSAKVEEEEPKYVSETHQQSSAVMKNDQEDSSVVTHLNATDKPGNTSDKQCTPHIICKSEVTSPKNFTDILRQKSCHEHINSPEETSQYEPLLASFQSFEEFQRTSDNFLGLTSEKRSTQSMHEKVKSEEVQSNLTYEEKKQNVLKVLQSNYVFSPSSITCVSAPNSYSVHSFLSQLPSSHVHQQAPPLLQSTALQTPEFRSLSQCGSSAHLDPCAPSSDKGQVSCPPKDDLFVSSLKSTEEGSQSNLGAISKSQVQPTVSEAHLTSIVSGTKLDQPLTTMRIPGPSHMTERDNKESSSAIERNKYRHGDFSLLQVISTLIHPTVGGNVADSKWCGKTPVSTSDYEVGNPHGQQNKKTHEMLGVHKQVDRNSSSMPEDKGMFSGMGRGQAKTQIYSKAATAVGKRSPRNDSAMGLNSSDRGNEEVNVQRRQSTEVHCSQLQSTLDPTNKTRSRSHHVNTKTSETENSKLTYTVDDTAYPIKVDCSQIEDRQLGIQLEPSVCTSSKIYTIRKDESDEMHKLALKNRPVINGTSGLEGEKKADSILNQQLECFKNSMLWAITKDPNNIHIDWETAEDKKKKQFDRFRKKEATQERSPHCAAIGQSKASKFSSKGITQTPSGGQAKLYTKIDDRTFTKIEPEVCSGHIVQKSVEQSPTKMKHSEMSLTGQSSSEKTSSSALKGRADELSTRSAGSDFLLRSLTLSFEEYAEDRQSNEHLGIGSRRDNVLGHTAGPGRGKTSKLLKQGKPISSDLTGEQGMTCHGSYDIAEKVTVQKDFKLSLRKDGKSFSAKQMKSSHDPWAALQSTVGRGSLGRESLGQRQKSQPHGAQPSLAHPDKKDKFSGQNQGDQPGVEKMKGFSRKDKSPELSFGQHKHFPVGQEPNLLKHVELSPILEKSLFPVSMKHSNKIKDSCEILDERGAKRLQRGRRNTKHIVSRVETAVQTNLGSQTSAAAGDSESFLSLSSHVSPPGPHTSSSKGSWTTAPEENVQGSALTENSTTLSSGTEICTDCSTNNSLYGVADGVNAILQKSQPLTSETQYSDCNTADSMSSDRKSVSGHAGNTADSTSSDKKSQSDQTSSAWFSPKSIPQSTPAHGIETGTTETDKFHNVFSPLSPQSASPPTQGPEQSNTRWSRPCFSFSNERQTPVSDTTFGTPVSNEGNFPMVFSQHFKSHDLIGRTNLQNTGYLSKEQNQDNIYKELDMFQITRQSLCHTSSSALVSGGSKGLRKSETKENEGAIYPSEQGKDILHLDESGKTRADNYTQGPERKSKEDAHRKKQTLQHDKTEAGKYTKNPDIKSKKDVPGMRQALYLDKTRAHSDTEDPDKKSKDIQRIRQRLRLDKTREDNYTKDPDRKPKKDVQDLTQTSRLDKDRAHSVTEDPDRKSKKDIQDITQTLHLDKIIADNDTEDSYRKSKEDVQGIRQTVHLDNTKADNYTKEPDRKSKMNVQGIRQTVHLDNTGAHSDSKDPDRKSKNDVNDVQGIRQIFHLDKTRAYDYAEDPDRNSKNDTAETLHLDKTRADTYTKDPDRKSKEYVQGIRQPDQDYPSHDHPSDLNRNDRITVHSKDLSLPPRPGVLYLHTKPVVQRARDKLPVQRKLYDSQQKSPKQGLNQKASGSPCRHKHTYKILASSSSPKKGKPPLGHVHEYTEDEVSSFGTLLITEENLGNHSNCMYSRRDVGKHAIHGPLQQDRSNCHRGASDCVEDGMEASKEIKKTMNCQHETVIPFISVYKSSLSCYNNFSSLSSTSTDSPFDSSLDSCSRPIPIGGPFTDLESPEKIDVPVGHTQKAAVSFHLRDVGTEADYECQERKADKQEGIQSDGAVRIWGGKCLTEQIIQVSSESRKQSVSHDYVGSKLATCSRKQDSEDFAVITDDISSSSADATDSASVQVSFDASLNIEQVPCDKFSGESVLDQELVAKPEKVTKAFTQKISHDQQFLGVATCTDRAPDLADVARSPGALIHRKDIKKISHFFRTKAALGKSVHHPVSKSDPKQESLQKKCLSDQVKGHFKASHESKTSVETGTLHSTPAVKRQKFSRPNLGQFNFEVSCLDTNDPHPSESTKSILPHASKAQEKLLHIHGPKVDGYPKRALQLRDKSIMSRQQGHPDLSSISSKSSFSDNGIPAPATQQPSALNDGSFINVTNRVNLNETFIIADRNPQPVTSALPHLIYPAQPFTSALLQCPESPEEIQVNIVKSGDTHAVQTQLSTGDNANIMLRSNVAIEGTSATHPVTELTVGSLTINSSGLSQPETLCTLSSSFSDASPPLHVDNPNSVSSSPSPVMRSPTSGHISDFRDYPPACLWQNDSYVSVNKTSECMKSLPLTQKSSQLEHDRSLSQYSSAQCSKIQEHSLSPSEDKSTEESRFNSLSMTWQSIKDLGSNSQGQSKNTHKKSVAQSSPCKSENVRFLPDEEYSKNDTTATFYSNSIFWSPVSEKTPHSCCKHVTSDKPFQCVVPEEPESALIDHSMFREIPDISDSENEQCVFIHVARRPDATSQEISRFLPQTDEQAVRVAMMRKTTDKEDDTTVQSTFRSELTEMNILKSQQPILSTDADIVKSNMVQAHQELSLQSMTSGDSTLYQDCSKISHSFKTIMNKCTQPLQGQTRLHKKIHVAKESSLITKGSKYRPPCKSSFDHREGEEHARPNLVKNDTQAGPGDRLHWPHESATYKRNKRLLARSAEVTSDSEKPDIKTNLCFSQEKAACGKLKQRQRCSGFLKQPDIEFPSKQTKEAKEEKDVPDMEAEGQRHTNPSSLSPCVPDSTRADSSLSPSLDDITDSPNSVTDADEFFPIGYLQKSNNGCPESCLPKSDEQSAEKLNFSSGITGPMFLDFSSSDRLDLERGGVEGENMNCSIPTKRKTEAEAVSLGRNCSSMTVQQSQAGPVEENDKQFHGHAAKALLASQVSTDAHFSVGYTDVSKDSASCTKVSALGKDLLFCDGDQITSPTTENDKVEISMTNYDRHQIKSQQRSQTTEAEQMEAQNTTTNQAKVTGEASSGSHTVLHAFSLSNEDSRNMSPVAQAARSYDDSLTERSEYNDGCSKEKCGISSHTETSSWGETGLSATIPNHQLLLRSGSLHTFDATSEQNNQDAENDVALGALEHGPVTHSVPETGACFMSGTTKQENQNEIKEILSLSKRMDGIESISCKQIPNPSSDLICNVPVDPRKLLVQKELISEVTNLRQQQTSLSELPRNETGLRQLHCHASTEVQSANTLFHFHINPHDESISSSRRTFICQQATNAISAVEDHKSNRSATPSSPVLLQNHRSLVSPSVSLSVAGTYRKHERRSHIAPVHRDSKDFAHGSLSTHSIPGDRYSALSTSCTSDLTVSKPPRPNQHSQTCRFSDSVTIYSYPGGSSSHELKKSTKTIWGNIVRNTIGASDKHNLTDILCSVSESSSENERDQSSGRISDFQSFRHEELHKSELSGDSHTLSKSDHDSSTESTSNLSDKSEFTEQGREVQSYSKPCRRPQTLANKPDEDSGESTNYEELQSPSHLEDQGDPDSSSRLTSDLETADSSFDEHDDQNPPISARESVGSQSSTAGQVTNDDWTRGRIHRYQCHYRSKSHSKRGNDL